MVPGVLMHRWPSETDLHVDTVEPTALLFSETLESGAKADPVSEPEAAAYQVAPEVRPSARTQAAFVVMKVPPAFLRGTYRSA